MRKARSPLTSPSSRDEIVETSIGRAVDSLAADAIDFLGALVRTPSLPGEEQHAQRLLAAELQSLPLDVTIVPSLRSDLEDHPAFCDDGVAFENRLNVVAKWGGSGQGRSLILNGHCDVVPTGEATLWSESPWSGAIRNGKLFGRGSCDMKGGLVAGLLAIRALHTLGFRPAGNLLFESVIGEESGGVGTLTTLVKGYRADGVIILEPTQLALCPVQSGALTFRLTVVGRSTHASMKPAGINAIEKCQTLINAINALERARHLSYRNFLYEDPMNVAPINIGTIRGGEWHSTVPNLVVVEGRCGVLPDESADQARRALADAIDRAASADLWLTKHRPRLEWFEGQFESGATPLDSPLLSALSESHRSVTDQIPRTLGVTYGSDLRLFTRYGRMPAVLYGPGHVARAHTVDEFVPLDEVVTCAKVVATLIVDWCGGAWASPPCNIA